MAELKDGWQSHYGSATPVAHILRHQVPDRWFRIHSLPESKRYADTPDEYSILLARHNAVATEILGSQTRCLLLVGRYTVEPELDIHSQDLPLVETVTFALFDSVREPDSMSIWYAPIIWSAERFDGIIKTVADDQAAHIMFASLETGEAYAPYDGGADLFLSSATRRNELKQRYSHWLSKHPQGL
ncbi:MAG: hypothetical protein H7Z75_18170 [Ferruginibacter sp.]|nr:hypothetical protein [Cytophagales bacterium]